MSNRHGPVHFCEWGKSYTPCGKREVRKSSDWADVTCTQCLTTGDVIRVIVGQRCAKTSTWFQHLLHQVMSKPGQTVYVNFDLPKAQAEIIEKYATIKKVESNFGHITHS